MLITPTPITVAFGFRPTDVGDETLVGRIFRASVPGRIKVGSRHFFRIIEEKRRRYRISGRRSRGARRVLSLPFRYAARSLKQLAERVARALN
ncbi:hypothetical protein EVAR_97873_1 [Eumeta japonica]|uniref:Uncharacterized protein n=1 Tax=Eumeta variegata TaxID=151549 RepID=A0A4C1WHH6_EUMVA|nr:hypothetical protein EVAR_97873_1 [Eumeta japonica]